MPCSGVYQLRYWRTGSAQRDKALALLHVLWLEYGPYERVIRVVCESVRGAPTDFGAEIFVASARDLAPSFYGRQVSLDDLERRLFPHALRLLGWSHIVDSCAQPVVCNAPTWYPSWSQTLMRVGSFSATRRTRTCWSSS